jgi:hypothetical protein
MGLALWDIESPVYPNAPTEVLSSQFAPGDWQAKELIGPPDLWRR